MRCASKTDGRPLMRKRRARADRRRLTFRSPLPKAEAPELWRKPFFKPVWFEDIFGLALDERTDWKRLENLLIASYATLAPKKLLEEAGLPVRSR